MYAFTFDKALQLINDQGIIAVRVLDAQNKKLAEWKTFSRSEDVAAKLMEYREEFSSYGRIVLVCATDKVLASNWTGALSWNITFDKQKETKQNGDGYYGTGAPKGWVSPEVATMMAQLESLKLQMQYNAQDNEFKLKLLELEKKDPMNYLGALALVMDIDDTKLNKAMKLTQLGSMMKGGNAGIAGIGTKTEEKTKLSTQMTQDELQTKLNVISEEVEKLINSVGVETVEKMILGLNKQADVKSTVNKLLTFID